MPRRPMIIFDETVVPGTVLLQIPFLKSTRLSPFLRTIANQVERSSGNGSYNRARILRYGLAIPNFRSALDWGRADLPDLPVRAESQVKLHTRLWRSFRRLPADIADGFELLRETSRIVSKSMECPAYARGPNVRSFGSLDRARCCPIRFFWNGADNRGAIAESPTPRARTYADRLSENSRKVALTCASAASPARYSATARF
jgi:hypothetical protein